MCDGKKRTKKIFVVGTGTDVGKTYVAALMVKKLRESGRLAGYYKAAMSGNLRRSDGTLIPGDAVHVKEISGSPWNKCAPISMSMLYHPIWPPGWRGIR